MIIVILNLSLYLILHLTNRICFPHESHSEEELEAKEEKAKSGVVKHFKHFDRKYLKRWFIFDYKRREADLEVKKEGKAKNEVLPELPSMRRTDSIEPRIELSERG